MSNTEGIHFEERIKEYEKWRKEKIKDLKYIFEVSGILIAFLMPIALKLEDYFSNEGFFKYFFMLAHIFLFTAFILNIVFVILLKNIIKIKKRTEEEVEDEIENKRLYMKLELFFVYLFFLAGIFFLIILIFWHYKSVPL